MSLSLFFFFFVLLVKSISIQPVEVKPPVVEETPAVNETRLRNLVSSAPVILFMKGTPEEAKCGFSRKTVALLQANDIPFASFNILTDDAVRAGLKKLFDWPTYPQLYVNGSLVGGLDILNDMAENGDLKSELGVTETIFRVTENTLDMKLKQLVNMAPVMLFMKGVPDAPQVFEYCFYYMHGQCGKDLVYTNNNMAIKFKYSRRTLCCCVCI